jgi:Rad3-related DNA helicase
MADASHDLILVDEAHNLVERGRDMYSATLDSKTLFYAKRKLRRFKLTSLKRALGKVEKAFAALGGRLSRRRQRSFTSTRRLQ